MKKYLYYRELTKEELEKLLTMAHEGNIPALFELVFQNQFLLNQKLNKLLKKK